MTEDFFSKNGLEIKPGEVEVGKTYPIYGMVTDILEENENSTFVEINYNIRMKVSIDKTQNKLELIKSRSFEPGIFIALITKKHDSESDVKHFVEAECTTMVFGKRKEYEA